MFNSIKSGFANHFNNFCSWKSKRKIIVIESDDWGSIRMPNRKVYEATIAKGINVDLCPFNSYDTLANKEDLEELFGVLNKYRDQNNRPPVITVNTIVANPDFEKIALNKFESYYYEDFTKTLHRYYPNDNVFEAWRYGIINNFIFPQLHGREHLYVKLWLDFLKCGSEETHFSFNQGYYGISKSISKEKRNGFLPAFNLHFLSEIHEQASILEDAQRIFTSIFGFRSESFIAPNYIWNRGIEPILNDLGMVFIQGSRYQREPIGGGEIRNVRHWTGETNSIGQIYLTRNVQFEPSIYKGINWVNYTIKQVENAFFWRVPAIISSHRLNFIGSLNKNNRQHNLVLLKRVLGQILERWPDVEFFTTNELGRLIASEP